MINSIKKSQSTIIKNTNIIKNELQNQDLKQKISMMIIVLFEFYKIIISTLLLIFVPQNCNGKTCYYLEKIHENNIFYLIGLSLNFITFFLFIILYAIEILRELKLIKYLDVNLSSSNDNEYIGLILTKLDTNILKSIYFIDYYYQKIGYICFIIFFINSLISTIILLTNMIPNQTITVLFNSIVFIATKFNQIYEVINTEKNIFYSAYLQQKVQYNDIDKQILIKSTKINNNNLIIVAPKIENITESLQKKYIEESIKK